MTVLLRLLNHHFVTAVQTPRSPEDEVSGLAHGKYPAQKVACLGLVSKRQCFHTAEETERQTNESGVLPISLTRAEVIYMCTSDLF